MGATRYAALIVVVCLVTPCAAHPAGVPRRQQSPADRSTEVMGFKPIRQAYPEDSKLLQSGEVDRKRNWCERARTLDLSTGTNLASKLRNIFNGTEISVAFTKEADDDFLHGTFNSVLWNEVANQLGFSWKNSFALLDPPPDYDWGSWFRSAAKSYDFVAEWGTTNPERMKNGIRFAYPIVDASLTMVGIVTQQPAQLYSKIVSFLRPFEGTTWLTIVAFFGITAWAYTRLERNEAAGDYADLEEKSASTMFFHSLYVSMSQFTGLGSFSARTWLGKTFAVSWSFMLLIITSSYTANLASLMVVKDSVKTRVSSFEDAMAQHMVVCTTIPGAHMLLEYYDHAHLKLVSNLTSGFEHVRKGACVGMVCAKAEWDTSKNRHEMNPECNLGIIGPPIIKYDGAWMSMSFADAGQRCTDVIADLITYALYDIRMRPVNLIQRTWESDILRQGDKECPPVAASLRAEGKSLGLEQLGGVMLFHVLVMTACLLLDRMGFHGWGGSTN